MCLGRERVAHPDVLAVFKRLILVRRRCDPVKAELAEERQEQILDQLVLAAFAG
jgi:hypothetical protein